MDQTREPVSSLVQQSSQVDSRFRPCELVLNSGWINLIEHQINDHTGYRNIQPQRQRDASDPAMTLEVSSQSAIESNQDKRHDHNSENCMSGENGEIDWARDSLARKARRSVIKVIDEIRDQKQCRHHKCADLAVSVSLYIIPPYEQVS